MGKLFEKLIENSKSDMYPFHMPGHKRNDSRMDICGIDITEIDGFDNMHNPEGIIKDTLEDITRFYESDKSYFLVNGSTGGILAAISSVTEVGDKILVARNSHKAVYNAIYLRQLMPVYVYPDVVFDGLNNKANIINGGISPAAVYGLLKENPDVKAVVITSPTYEGLVSDVKKIAEICHSCNVPLIVDEAHGAHFDMHDYFPNSALSMGADIVIQSLHKTLPSLTQTGIIHVKSKLINKKKLEKFLSIYQTSSPSYVFMSSMENCIEEVMRKGSLMFDEYVDMVESFRTECRKLTHIKLLESGIKGKAHIYDIDKTRLVIFLNTNKMNGKELYNKLLYKYHIQMEMAALGYVIAITSVRDTKEGFDRLLNALIEIDRELRLGTNMNRVAQAYSISNLHKPSVEAVKDNLEWNEGNGESNIDEFIKNYREMKAIVYEKISDVDNQEVEILPLRQAVGKIAAEFIYVYPPGVPIIAPGEMISGENIGAIETYISNNLNIYGLEDIKKPAVKVVREAFKRMDITEVFGKKIYREISKEQ